MAKAANDLLEQIHALIAQDMLERLQSGTCEAKDWAVIVKFLKDNNIDAAPDGAADTASAFADLVKAAGASISKYQ